MANRHIIDFNVNMNAKHNRILTLILCLLMLSTLGAASNPLDPELPHYAYIPAVTNNTVFSYGVSRYMSTTNVNTLNNLGCAQGRATPAGASMLVILDFGQPAYDASTNTYGTYIFGTYDFRSVNQIAVASESYLNSFYLCSPPGAYLYLGVGTVNYGSGVTSGHGAAWARMINDIAAWIVDSPSIASKVTVRGANDMEPGFGTAFVTRAWVDGYTSGYTGTSYLYNYGSCDGCPFGNYGAGMPKDWTVEQLYYVTWGAPPSWPVPEIYAANGVHAEQWYRMSLYAKNIHGQAMEFKGSLTQWQACQERGCNYTNNTPLSGWQQLNNTVDADSLTRQKDGLATDITWGN
jgi:hypothetical protein